MRNINDLLDAAKEVTGSDNQTAERLGTYQQTVSGWRKGKSKPNDVDRAELCKITGWSFEEVVAAVNYESNPAYWENFLKRLGGIAAAVLVCVTLIVTPTPSEAAPLQSTAMVSTVYYVKLRRMLKQLALSLVEQISRFGMPVLKVS